MDRDTNPLLVTIFFVARCLIPVGLMLGVSYLLKRLKILPDVPPVPDEENGAEQKPGGGSAHD